MSDFNYVPLSNASVKRAPRFRKASFGDGYSQRIVDGINANPQEWSLMFRDDKSTIQAIDDYLSAKGGADSFTWTTPKGEEITVVCESWSMVHISPLAGELSATFVQVFE